MWKSKILISLVAASVLLAGCKVQSVQQYEDEQQDKNSKVVVVDSIKDEKKMAEGTKDVIDKKELTKKTTENPTQNKTNSTTNQPAVKVEKIEQEQSTAVVKTPKEKTEVKKTEATKVVPNEKKVTVKSNKTIEEKKTKEQVKAVEQPRATNSNTPPNSTESAKKPTAVKQVVKKEYATVTIGMKVLLNSANYEQLPAALQSTKYVPTNGVVVSGVKVAIEDGDKAWDAILQVKNKYGLAIDYRKDPLLGIYIKGINHVYEKQVGDNSGWMYTVNGVKAPVGVGNYTLEANDAIELQYTTNAGMDLGW